MGIRNKVRQRLKFDEANGFVICVEVYGEKRVLGAALKNDVAGVNAESHIVNDLSQEGVLVRFSVKCILLE